MAAAGNVAKNIDIQDRKKQEKLDERRRRQSTLGKFIEHIHTPSLLTERKTGKQVLAQLKTYFGHWYKLPMEEISEWRLKRWRQDRMREGLLNSSVDSYLNVRLNRRKATGNEADSRSERVLRCDAARTAFLPCDLEKQIERFVDHYNHQRYHESLKNLTPADVYFGRGQSILTTRERIKQKTIAKRRLRYQQCAA